MSHEFKAGDFAIVIGGGDLHNLGKCVELVMCVPDWGMYRPPLSCNWDAMINTSGGPVWIVLGDLTNVIDNSEVIRGWCQKAAFNLMPLRGDFAPERQKAQEQPA